MIVQALLILLGIACAAFGIEGFLIPNHFIDGGVTGVSMLLSQTLNLPLALFLVICNAPFVALGAMQLGMPFTRRASIAIVGLALCLVLIEFPPVTSDKLLGAVFGGFFLGSGIGLAIRGGAILDGTEILAVVVSKKSSASVGEVIMAINIVIFLTAALLLGIEPALYSMLTYFSASKMVDFLLYGLEAYYGMTIVSQKAKAVRAEIINSLGRGVTVLKGSGGLTAEEQEILYCVVTRLEIPKLKTAIEQIDPAAFYTIHHITEATGGVVKRRVMH